jgi:membrane protein YqaA with SNARE-associated domain
MPCWEAVNRSTPDPSTPPARGETGNQPFTTRHALAILGAVAITVLIVVFQERLRGLGHLAYLGAFLTMLIGNATVILPVPGLAVVFALGASLNPLLLGLAAGPGAALGELTGYLMGYGGSAVADDLKVYRTIERWMERYGIVVIAVLAAIPNPLFDVAGMVAGVMRIRWWHFLLAALLGKTIQALVVAHAGALSLGWMQQFLH